jgi:hypothetical protein
MAAVARNIRMIRRPFAKGAAELTIVRRPADTRWVSAFFFFAVFRFVFHVVFRHLKSVVSDISPAFGVPR